MEAKPLECGGLTPPSQIAISYILIYKAASSRRTPKHPSGALQFEFIRNAEMSWRIPSLLAPKAFDSLMTLSIHLTSYCTRSIALALITLPDPFFALTA
jgi:hypothetical protein